MSEALEQSRPKPTEYMGVYRDGAIRLCGMVDWPDGTPVSVRIADLDTDGQKDIGRVIVAGFGLAGRWVADIFDRHGIEYVVIELNSETVVTQRKLGRNVVGGDVAAEATLREAGIEEASILVLTIPEEDAVIQATQLARRLKPSIYIVARTNYSSAGLQATACGADDVIKAEQVVARQFYEMLLRRLGRNRQDVLTR